MTGIQLKKAELTDIPLIRHLAEKIWRVHYPEIIGTEQVEYMLKKMYDEKSLHEQMTAAGHVFYLVMCDGKESGFVSVSSADKKNWMLHKFYILSENQKKGVGSVAFRQLLQQLHPASTIRLTVNRQNYKSINFYFKNGFVIEKVADFDIGEGYVMNDFVMLRTC